MSDFFFRRTEFDPDSYTDPLIGGIIRFFFKKETYEAACLRSRLAQEAKAMAKAQREAEEKARQEAEAMARRLAEQQGRQTKIAAPPQPVPLTKQQRLDQLDDSLHRALEALDRNKALANDDRTAMRNRLMDEYFNARGRIEPE